MSCITFKFFYFLKSDTGNLYNKRRNPFLVKLFPSFFLSFFISFFLSFFLSLFLSYVFLFFLFFFFILSLFCCYYYILYGIQSPRMDRDIESLQLSSTTYQQWIRCSSTKNNHGKRDKYGRSQRFKRFPKICMEPKELDSRVVNLLSFRKSQSTRFSPLLRSLLK